MPDPRVAAAIFRGATIVTPNNRLARDIVARHDDAQRKLGLSAWPAARALPWNAFVGELWQLALDVGLALPPHRLDAAQCSWLWRRIVARDLKSTPLVNIDAAAALAAEAWELMHAYGAGRESWRGFRGGGGDPEAFARWAEAFQRETGEREALDAARAADTLVPHATALCELRIPELVGFGFLEFAPQQKRLLDALARAGVRVTTIADAGERPLAPAARLAAADTRQDEIARALAWARERALAEPEAAIGIVVLDLAERQVLVRAMAEDALCPARQWPGHESAPRPYDVSVGDALGAVPLVCFAIDLIALGHGPLDVASAAALLRCPFLPDAERAFASRAALERLLLEAGSERLLLPVLLEQLARSDPALAARWRSAMAAARMPARASPREWAQRWRAWLVATGWCEGRTLSSTEYQANGAWSKLLTAFARLGTVSGEIARDDALAALRRAAGETPFQPESTGAQVRILGALEAAGLAFDALWVAGCTAEAWPSAPAPNPLLPAAWQREHRVPRSHAARELEYARRLTTCLSHGAPEVVFSYARSHDDHPCAPSPLLSALATIDPPGAEASTARTLFGARPRLERRPDATAPPVPAGTHLAGGAGMIDAQSTCPFKATARYRLDAREWPAASATLDPAERGNLVHATLEAFWRDVRDQPTLAALSDEALDAKIAKAVDRALRSLPAERWQALPRVVGGGEGPRIAGLVRQWLTEVDRARAPFAVVALETDTAKRLRLGPVTLDVKFDRLDAFADGSVAIIDYKSGRAVAPAKWFEARPQAPQLVLYAMAHAQREEPRPLKALVYGQIRPGEVRAVGLAADATCWPGLVQPAQIRAAALADWNAAATHWQDAMLALAGDIVAGDARVSPRDATACHRCHLQAVCRIGAVTMLDADANDNADGGNGDA